MKFDSIMRFEIRALVFYKLTGQLAPGKDSPAAMYPVADRAWLQSQWEAFCKIEGPIVDDTLAAIEKLTESQP